jgi:hypothetical protein
MIKAITTFFQLVLFFLNLNKESNKKKAKEKAELGKEVVDALAETNPARRASYLNNVVVKLRDPKK